jgi:predicted transcriptional regulator
MAPSDKRFTGRTEQMNLKVSKEFKKRLKILAAEERRLMVEVLEKALEVYERERKNN